MDNNNNNNNTIKNGDILPEKKMIRIMTHPRDALIQFEAGPHKYTCAGEGNYVSVTTWNHSHFKPFDADAIIAKMRLTTPSCKYYGQTPDQIKAGWDQVRDEAASAGTELHAQIEHFWLDLDLHLDLEEHYDGNADANSDASLLYLAKAKLVSPLFAGFVAKHPHLLRQPCRCEWMIFDEEVRLAGSIDFVTENPDGTLTIYDWKRCKDIKKANGFGDFALTECISHFPDTNYWHYALQLNTYKAILERNYGKKVKDLYLVCLHPNLPTYQVYTVPKLEKELDELFEIRKSQLNRL
jgi:hypothetical protein